MKTPNQQTTKQYNVSKLTPIQRRKLITQAMNQQGFVGYIKKQTNNQTHYTFQYKN